MEHASHISELVWGVFTLLLTAIVILILARRARLPFTVLLVPVGIGLSLLKDRLPDALGPLEQLAISPDLILYVFLPTLLFESSYNLDAGRLRHNLAPILVLAVPGVLLSTALIGLIVWFATGIPLPAALLLGAILSATDPVAVVSLFRQIGAPERLTTLVEGESLFNDASAIVLTKILLGILLAGTLGEHALVAGIGDFIVLFVGGLAVGIGLGYVTSTFIGWVESEPFVEIGLTTALAYISFLLADQVFHVSGVMATVGAGLTIGTWGRIRISSSVRDYLEQFWSLLAFLASALLFLMVGMTVDLASLWNAMDLMLWVVAAMLIARAVVLFGMSPMIGRFSGAPKINLAYQFVMFWGGLRGAIALALVLSLPDFEYSELFVALVTGAVLFTLLVQGLTIEPILHKLGLDIPPLADRVLFLENTLVSRQRALDRLPKLQQGGIFSSRIARRLVLECDEAIASARREIQKLRLSEMDRSRETQLLYMRALTEEKAVYSEMFSNGNLSEGAFRELVLVLNQQIDALRYHGAFEHVHTHRLRRSIEQAFYRRAESFTWLRGIAERMHLARIVRDYEEIWGHYQGSSHVLASLDAIAKLESTPADVVKEVRGKYEQWNRLSAEQLHQVSEQFPEFAISMQERLGKRLILQSELETTEEQGERGVLPKGVALSMEAEYERQLAELRGQPVEHLDDSPEMLLRKVPLFSRLDKAILHALAQQTYTQTLNSGEYLIREGEPSDALYLLSRGVVRLYQTEQGMQHDLGSLMAGESFGEKALMNQGKIDVGAFAVTPCRFYILEYEKLNAFLQKHPQIAGELQERDQLLRSRYAAPKSGE